ncbi:hypothetical protein EVAR_48071_1 [Eumeta japonica]|uniref:Uncharacterized protein n=1 Tax=Eumeta variegata TaxID=151549 RepID=A0A4C1XA10_EUMVA|nr:hypothetical protein EVAR_48071_1 [Eumeta japonica]
MATTEDNISAVWLMIETNKRVIYRQIRTSSGIGMSQVHQTLHEHLACRRRSLQHEGAASGGGCSGGDVSGSRRGGARGRHRHAGLSDRRRGRAGVRLRRAAGATGGAAQAAAARPARPRRSHALAAPAVARHSPPNSEAGSRTFYFSVSNPRSLSRPKPPDCFISIEDAARE